MKKYLIPTALLLVTALSSCTKTIDEDLSGNERSPVSYTHLTLPTKLEV